MYTQQDVRKIVVVVKGEGMVAAAGIKEKEPEEIATNTSEESPAQSYDKAALRKKRIIITNATHSFAVSKQIFYLGANYGLSRIGARTGDQELQDRISRKVETFKDVSNFASSIAMGWTYGKWGGPVGAVIGMTLGGLSAAASTAVKYGERRVEYDYKVFKQNNAIEYQRARANLTATTGRLR